jgi:hypothetical protein
MPESKRRKRLKSRHHRLALEPLLSHHLGTQIQRCVPVRSLQPTKNDKLPLDGRNLRDLVRFYNQSFGR